MPTLLSKCSRWLAEAVTYSVRLECEMAAIPLAERDKAADAGVDRLMDAENRLALALEAFGEVVTQGDLARATACVEELEKPVWATSESARSWRQSYPDPIAVRRVGRREAGALARKRKLGQTGPDIRALEREVKAGERRQRGRRTRGAPARQ